MVLPGVNGRISLRLLAFFWCFQVIAFIVTVIEGDDVVWSSDSYAVSHTASHFVSAETYDDKQIPNYNTPVKRTKIGLNNSA